MRFLLLFVLLLGGIGVPLYRNEGLRALLAAEALGSGTWTVPHLYGEPHLNKPPGMGVLIVVCSIPFGEVTPFSARLPSVLAGVALLGMAYAVFRRFGPEAGWLAAALMPCSLLWLDRVPSAEIDLVQAAWVAGSMLCLLRGWWLGAMACVAGGFFTKWTAPAFFCLTAVAWLAPQRKLHLLLSRGHLLALAAFVALMVGWLLAVASSVGWPALMEALSREALMRLSPQHHPRPYPWGELLTFPLSFLLGCLPAAVFLPFAWKRPDDERQAELHGLCWAWLLANLLFWTVVPGHRPRHILPAQPAVALLSALGALRLSSLIVPILLACWTGVKVGYVALVMAHRPHALETAAKLRLLIPPDRVLHLDGLKDEGLMFAYGRPARRGASPTEWRLTPGEGSDGLRDSQGAPLVLLRPEPYPSGDALTGRLKR